MTTIRRNWTNRVAQIRAAAQSCRAYDASTGNMVPADPARAFEAWEAKPRARLTEDTPGQKWTVHVHSNEFYTLTAEAPETPEVATAHADRAGESSPAAAQDHRAARTVTRHRRAAEERHSLPGHLPTLAVDLTGKTVRVKLAQGYSHEQIRDEFEQARAQAQAAGDTKRANGLATMLRVHAAMAEEAAADSPTGPSSPPQQPASRRAREDDVLSRIDSVLHDAAVTDDPAVSDDAMRSIPLADPGEIIHAYTRAQALADGVLVAADADLAREAGFRVPVALTSAVWEGCVAWNDSDSERQVPQDERGRLWDVLTMSHHAIRRSDGSGDRVTVDLLRVPRDGRTTQAQPVQLVCAIGPGDRGEPVITIMQPDED
ncbi:DUF6573 family protein [Streptomyces sp. NPDC057413]|uniref:DUF6573 family protein n=1 Tax=Streptomyces sp. NPDC057413 TaxID=3346124 RepID=UPI0036C40DC2